MTDEEWEDLQKKLQPHFDTIKPPDTGDSGGFISSLAAGGKGALKEVAGSVGIAPDWSKSKDQQHGTAEWVGRKAADWAPVVAFDAVAPELAPFAGGGRLAMLANRALTGAYKGAAGGVTAQPSTRGAETGAETGAIAGATRAGWGMLPGWAKTAAAMAPFTIPSWYNLSHELGGNRGGAGYISPWAMHHVASALAGLAAAAAKMPATAGAAASSVEDWFSPGK